MGFEEMPVVYNDHKDRVFRKLLMDKHRLLEVYNALNGTEYEDVETLEVTTLENVLFVKMKNDVSFILDCDMCLYEHQSTYCPNMPLRGFLYFADLYRKRIKGIELSVRKLIKIPTPYYVVFYNGTERHEEEFYQYLSEAFEEAGDGCLELKVRTININYGHNKELMERCKTLADYSYFIASIRKHKATQSLGEAVCCAVEECIENDVLREFLMEQKSEVIAMSIYEYNEEYARQSFFEEGQEEGYGKGVEVGFERGMVRGREEGRELGSAFKLKENIIHLMKSLKITTERACEMLGTSVEEYRKACELLAEDGE